MKAPRPEVLNKDRFDACMTMANFAASRWDARRTHEAQLSFAIWAVIAAAILCVRAEQFPWTIGAALVALHLAWLRASDVRNRQDGKIAWNCVNAADSALGMHLVPDKPKMLKFDWGLPIKVAFTVGLMVMFYAICVAQVTWLTIDGVVLSKP